MHLIHKDTAVSETPPAGQRIRRTARAAAILLLCTAWFLFVLYCGSNRTFTIPRGCFVERMLDSFPDTRSSTIIQLYLSQGGFVLLAFYLTVLIPDLLRRFFPERQQLHTVCRISICILLPFGALCSIAGCLTNSHAPLRWLQSAFGSPFLRFLQYTNILLVPVVLGLILLTWFVPTAVVFFKNRIQSRSLTLSFAAKTAAFWSLLILFPLFNFCFKNVMLPVFNALFSGYEKISAGDSDTARFLSAFFSSLVLAPVFEEAAFRGQIQHHIKKVLPAWAAVLISAVFFGLWHRNLYQFIYTAWDGLLIGLLYNGTGRIRHTVCFHFTNNLLSVLEGSKTASCVLGKMTVFPSVSNWLTKLSFFPALLLALLFLLAAFSVLEALLWLANGRKSLLMKYARRIKVWRKS